MKFAINREFLSSVKGAHGRYVADLEAERELREKEEREKKKAEKEKEENAEKNESLAKLEMELNKHQTKESIKIGNQKLQEALSEKSLSREKIQSAQAMIDMGLEWKHKLNNVIEEITKKKKIET